MLNANELAELLSPQQLRRELDDIVFVDVDNDDIRDTLRALCALNLARIEEGEWTEDMQDEHAAFSYTLERTLEECGLKACEVPEIRKLELITNRVLLLGLNPQTQYWLYDRLTSPKMPVCKQPHF